jgi:hypothetical protein
LERKLDDKERELDSAGKKLRQERNATTATSVRARREQVLKSRASTTPSSIPPPKTPSSAATAPAPGSTPTDEIEKIRVQVLELLEKHDQSKVNRIDIIMEKFKGKEALLLEKMTQRYEGTYGYSQSFTKRNEIALQRHQERMRKMRETKGENGTSPGP